jgi:hypothetical protein
MSAITSNGTGGGNWSATATWTGGVVPGVNVAITNCTNSGGLVEITLASAVPWGSNETVSVYGVVGTTEANGYWTLTKIDSTHFTLQGSAFANPYSGGGVAYHGDTVTIAAGDTVTLNSAACDASGQLIVGTNPNTGGTDAVHSNALGRLTISSGLTLRLRGNAYVYGQEGGSYNPGGWTLNSGASLILDPPSGQQYKVTIRRAGTITCNGTIGSHCTIKTDLSRGGTAGYFANAGDWQTSSWAALTAITYTDFANFGDGTNPGLVTTVNNSAFTNISPSITNCTFNACSYMVNGNTSWDANFTFTNNVFTNSATYTLLGNAGVSFGLGLSTTPSVGTRLVNQCGFDGTVQLDACQYIKTTQCVFAGGWNTSGASFWPDATYFDTNIIYDNVGRSPTLGGSMQNCYWLGNSTNHHYGSTAAGSTNVGNILEALNNDSTGDFFVGAGNVAYYKCFILRTGTNGNAGSLCSALGKSSGGITVEHCLTWGPCNNGGAFCNISEGGNAQYAGGIASMQSNILFAESANAASWLIWDGETVHPTTLGMLTLADYNCLHNPTTSTDWVNGVAQTNAGYLNCNVTSAANIGPHDFLADPMFADQDYRGFLKWGVKTQGTANTIAAVLAALLANPSLSSNLVTWVRAGYAPTNPALVNATYPGDTMTLDANGNALNGTIGPMAATIGGIPYPMGSHGAFRPYASPITGPNISRVYG